MHPHIFVVFSTIFLH